MRTTRELHHSSWARTQICAASDLREEAQEGHMYDDVLKVETNLLGALDYDYRAAVVLALSAFMYTI